MSHSRTLVKLNSSLKLRHQNGMARAQTRKTLVTLVTELCSSAH